MNNDDSRLSMQGLPPTTGAGLIFVLANALSDGLTPEESGVLGNFIAALGDTIAYIGSQKELNSQQQNAGAD